MIPDRLRDTSGEPTRIGAGRRPTAYRERTLAAMRTVWDQRPPAASALDFGSGDGWFTRHIAQAGIARKIVPVDVKLWPTVVMPPVLFDGRSLPFRSRAFDLVFAVDVIHHCAEPERAIDELLRCSNEYFLIKDHTYRTAIDRWLLTLLDELGNRRFRVPSPHRYQQGWSWNELIERRGFRREALLSPVPCHIGPLGYCSNQLQFVALWRRIEDRVPATPS